MLKASEQNKKLPALLSLKALAFLRRDSGVLSFGLALVSDLFVFLKSRGFPELDFLSLVHAPLPLCATTGAEPRVLSVSFHCLLCSLLRIHTVLTGLLFGCLVWEDVWGWGGGYN